jgi:hypothetical protein
VAGRPGAERDVEQHDVVRPVRGGLQRHLPVRHRGHAMALALERPGQHLAQRTVVVDEQDVERRGGLHGAEGNTGRRYWRVVMTC